MAEQRHALVIDDDEDLRVTVAQVLADHGWVTEGYGEGVSALARLRAEPLVLPSLLLLDLMMPVMNGWQFLKEKRGDPRLAPIPVVLMTAGRPTPQSDEGVVSVLQKPFSVEALVEATERACS
jgi:CheY-like chemotaxis protein